MMLCTVILCSVLYILQCCVLCTVYYTFSAHVERLDSDWTMNGKSILEGGAAAGPMSATYYAQRRIALSNFKRYQEPASRADEGLHLYERTVESSTCFRKQMEVSGQLDLEESRNLASLERNMKAITPIIDGVIFLGRLIINHTTR